MDLPFPPMNFIIISIPRYHYLLINDEKLFEKFENEIKALYSTCKQLPRNVVLNEIKKFFEEFSVENKAAIDSLLKEMEALETRARMI